MIGVMIVGFPFFTYWFLNKNQDKLEDEEFSSRIESLVLNLRSEDNRARKLVSFMLGRRLILTLSS
jgi:hypothetical protein